MSEVSPQKLFKKLQLSSNIKLVSDIFSHGKIKASKKVYNIETRNIKLFLKQQKQMQAKRKQQHISSHKTTNQKKRYDDNQLMQLQYHLSRSEQKPVYIERCQTQPSQITSNQDKKYLQTRQFNKINTSTNLDSLDSSKIFLNRPKRVSQIQPSMLNKFMNQSLETLPRIVMRKKSKSTFEQLDNRFRLKEMDISQKLRLTNLYQSQEGIKKSASSFIDFSSKVLTKRNKNISTLQKNNDKLVEITDDKMTRYLKSLYTLINDSYQHGSSIDEKKANQIILNRYTVQKKINHKDQVKQIDRQSQDKMFQFPYMQFISESQTRKSIHRIINMSIKNTQKVVFKLLDFNKNGFIDEKDLINLIELSEKIPDLKSDLLKIAHYVCKSQNFSVSNAKSMSYREESQRQIQTIQEIPQRYQTVKTPKKQKNPNNTKMLNLDQFIRERTNTFSTSQLTELMNPIKSAKKQSNFGSSSFNKERLYSFFETKNKFFNSNKIKDQFKFIVTLQDFFKIFANQRPSTFHDIIKFLFNVKQQDLIQKIIIQNDQVQNLVKKQTKPKKNANSGFKNYDVPGIIKDMQKKFQCNIEKIQYEDVLNIEKISQRSKNK